VSQQINLYSPLFLRKQLKHFSTVSMLQALGLIVAGAALLYGYLVYNYTGLTAQAAETEQKLAGERERLAKFTSEYAPQQKSAQLETEIKNATAQLKARMEMVETLKNGATIGSTEGYSEYMRAFARQSVNGLWLTGFDIAGAGTGTALSIIGRTVRPELVPLYVQHLSREPVMKGRQFSFLQMSLPGQANSAAKPGRDLRYLEFNLQSAESGKTE
jgi:hypothetical protein